MALDPSISLAYRPPEINVPIPQPLQQFGQILTLRNLMQQGQLFPLELQTKQLGLQQAQLAYQRDLAMADLLQHPEKYQTPTPGAPAVPSGDVNAGTGPVALGSGAPATTTAPGSFVMAQGQGGDAVHSLDGGVNWVSSATGTPYTGPRYAETPAGVGIGGALSPPAPPPAAAPTAAAPAAPAVPSGGIPGLPSWQQMLRAGGPAAFPWIKNINEAQKSQLEVEAKQLENAQAHSKDAARILNGMVDNESKNRLLPEAAAKGYITGDEARQFYNMDFNDPRFQARKDSESKQALTYDQLLDAQIKANKEKRDQNEEMRKFVEFHNKQFEQEKSDFKGQVGALTDASQFGPLLATKSDRLKAMYGGLVNQPLNDIKIWTGAAKPGVEVPKPASVTAQETAQAGARAGAEAGARITAEDAPYMGLAQRFKNKEIRWDQLSPTEQEHVGRIVTPPGSERTTRMSDTESKGLTNFQTGLDAVQSLRKEMTGPWSLIKTGKFSDIFQGLPIVGAKWDALEGRFGMLQATVGDLIKGGVLRAADQKVYQQMFPKLDDSPWTVREKLTNLETKLNNDLGRYKESLRAQSRYIPGETPAATPAGPGATPTPASPSYQTIEKTGAPGPRVTGTITIGGAAAAPPGKIVVQAPASRGGGKYYLDSDKWPQYQSQGFTRAEQ